MYYPKLFERMKKELIEYDNEELTEGPKWWNREKGIKEKMPDFNER